MTKGYLTHSYIDKNGDTLFSYRNNHSNDDVRYAMPFREGLALFNQNGKTGVLQIVES